MRTVALIFLAAYSSFAKADDSPVLIAKLQEAKEKWQQNGAQSYSFVISDGCFCMHPPYVGPLRITVKSGETTRAVYLGRRWGGYWRGRLVREKTSLRTTVPELFAQIERLTGIWKPEYIRVEFDSHDGHPTIFEYDDPAFEDEQTAIKVTDFKPL